MMSSAIFPGYRRKLPGARKASSRGMFVCCSGGCTNSGHVRRRCDAVGIPTQPATATVTSRRAEMLRRLCRIMNHCPKAGNTTRRGSAERNESHYMRWRPANGCGRLSCGVFHGGSLYPSNRPINASIFITAPGGFTETISRSCSTKSMEIRTSAKSTRRKRHLSRDGHRMHPPEEPLEFHGGGVPIDQPALRRRWNFSTCGAFRRASSLIRRLSACARRRQHIHQGRLRLPRKFLPREHEHAGAARQIPD